MNDNGDHQVDWFLFSFWKVETVDVYILTLLATFAIAIFNQLLFWILVQKAPEGIARSDILELVCGGDGGCDNLIDVSYLSRYLCRCVCVPHSAKKAAFYCTKVVVFMLQVTVSYMLMLILMTYNVGICLMLLAGCSTGYMAFSVVAQAIVDRLFGTGPQSKDKQGINRGIPSGYDGYY